MRVGAPVAALPEAEVDRTVVLPDVASLVAERPVTLRSPRLMKARIVRFSKAGLSAKAAGAAATSAASWMRTP